MIHEVQCCRNCFHEQAYGTIKAICRLHQRHTLHVYVCENWTPGNIQRSRTETDNMNADIDELNGIIQGMEEGVEYIGARRLRFYKKVNGVLNEAIYRDGMPRAWRKSGIFVSSTAYYLGDLRGVLIHESQT